MEPCPTRRGKRGHTSIVLPLGREKWVGADGASLFWQQELGMSRFSRDEIRPNHANLNIPLYVPTNGNGKAVNHKTLALAIADWRRSSRQLRLSLDGLLAKLNDEGNAQNQDAR